MSVRCVKVNVQFYVKTLWKYMLVSHQGPNLLKDLFTLEIFKETKQNPLMQFFFIFLVDVNIRCEISMCTKDFIVQKAARICPYH